ncbi:MAG TPA: transcription-repair coupling factor, partial [Bacilli bacterium]
MKDLNAFSNDADYQSIVEGIRIGMKEQFISGLVGSSRQVLIASLVQELDKPLFIITHNMFSAQKIVDDLNECLSREQVLLYPANELIVTEAAIASPELLAQRIDALIKLSQGFRGVVVAPYAGVRRLIPPLAAFSEMQIQVGDTVQLDPFIQTMSHLGYDRVERVESKGEMSVRGGIIDFFPLTSATGFRIEFFDDTVDSIRSFNTADQRSIEKLTAIAITPCKEIIADSKRFQNAAQHAYELLEQQLLKMTDRKAKDKLKGEIGQDIEKLREGIYFQGIYKYISMLFPERQTLLDYVPKDSLLILDEPIRLIETSKQLERDEAESVTDLLQNGKTLPAFILSKTYDSLLYHKPFQSLYLSLFLRQVPQTQPQNIVNFMCRAMQSFHGQMNVLKSEMERWKKMGSRVVLLANGEERIERMRRILQDYLIDEPHIMNGNLQTGFELPSAQLVIITEGEIFTQKHRKTRNADKRIENDERIKSYSELKVGDY